jgi:hypothetical protein
MSGGGVSSTPATSTTTTGPQGYVQPYAKSFLANVSDYATGDLQNLWGILPTLSYNVAPFQGSQNQALGMGGSYYPSVMGGAKNITPQAQNLANLGGSTVSDYASGGMMGPNPYLNQYYNQAATQLSNQYKYATQPSLAAQYQQAGAFNSPGFAEAQGQAQYGLGQGLGTLAANTYEPAYQFESGQRLAAGEQLPSIAQGLYGPLQSQYSLAQGAINSLYGLGAAQQQQQQNLLNAQRMNAAQNLNLPFSLLSQLGGALGQANLGGGTTVSTGPAAGGGK